MKRFLVVILQASTMMLALTLVFSCSNQEVSLQTISTEENNPYKWDESFHVNSSTRASESPNEAYEFVPDGLTSGVYPGLVLSGSSISAPPLRPTALSTLKDSIDVCFDMPGYYCERIYPRGTSYKNALNHALKSPDFSGEQLEQFEYDLKQFSRYDEMKLAFGANVNVAKILRLDASYDKTKIKHKTGLFARVYQRNFTATMDYPSDGNLFKNNNDLNSFSDDVYINSIVYGRLAIISIESDSSYNDVKSAFKASLNIGKFGGEASLDVKSKKILDNSDVHVYILGGEGNTAAQTFSGISKFMDFITSGGVFSKNKPGVPIYITTNYLKDNSICVSHFTIEGDR